MKRCPTCQRTFDDSQSFCVVDGAPLSPPDDSQATLQLPGARNTDLTPELFSPEASQNSLPRSGEEAAISFTEQNRTEINNSRRTVFIIVGLISVLLIGGLVYLATRPETGGGTAQQRLEGTGVVRAGAPEFEKFRSQIVLDKPEATEATRAIGDIVMTLRTTVRNFTGRTINGLEMYAAVVDSQGKPVKDRTVIVIPTRQPELEPNKTMEVPVMLDGMKKDDDRADIKMDVTAVKFK